MSMFTKILISIRYKCNKAAILRLHRDYNGAHFARYLQSRAIVSLLKYSEEEHVNSTCQRRAMTTLVKHIAEQPPEDEHGDTISSKRIKDRGRETSYLYSILSNSMYYKDTIVPAPIATQIVSNEDAKQILERDWSMEEYSNVLAGFKKLSYHSMSNDNILPQNMYDSILNGLANHASKLKKEDIRRLLQYMIPLHKSLKTLKSYINLCRRIDSTYEKNMSQSTVNELLVMADLFFQVEMQDHVCMFLILRKLCSKIRSISAKNLIQILFYVSTMRKMKTNMYEIEYRLSECFDDITVDELAVVALAFFKTRTNITNSELTMKIIKKLTDNVKIVDGTAVSSIMKVIRYSAKLHTMSEYRVLLCSLVDEVDRLPLVCLTQIAHLTNKIYMCENALMHKIADRLSKEISTARLKDIDRILMALVMVSPTTDYPVYQDVITELECTYKTSRKNEIKQYQHILSSILAYLSYKNVYSSELISYVLDRKFKQNVPLQPISRAMIIINFNVKIDNPAYDGPVLESRVCESFMKRYVNDVKDLQINSKLMKMYHEIVHTLSTVCNVPACTDYLLPQYTVQDIVLGFDTNNQPVPVKPILSAMPFGDVKNVTGEEYRHLKWIVFVPLVQHNIIVGTEELTGIISAKFRHLKLCGYIPIPIYCTMWEKLMSTEDKACHLENLIDSAMEGKFNTKAQLL